MREEYMTQLRRGVRLAHVVLLFALTGAGVAAAQSEDVGALQRQVAQLFQAGRHSEAKAVAQRYVQAARAHYGEGHVEYARAVSWLGHIYDSLDRYGEAEPLYALTVAILEKRLGPNDPNVGATLNDLASLYRKESRYDEAQAVYERVLAIGEKTFGAQHPNVGAVLNNMAGLYQTQGRYREAETYYKRALAIGEKNLGRDNLDVAKGFINLGRLYVTQGRYAEAEVLYKHVLAIREKKLGARHPDVGTTLNSFALLYANQGQFAEAEPLYRRALAIYEAVQGPDHPNVVTVLNNLGELKREQGQLAEAEPLYKQALAIAERTVGPEDVSLAALLNNLALLYRSQDRYGEAEALYKRALAIEEKKLGPDHREVGRRLNNLAGVYTAEGRYADAEPLYKRALAIEEKALGPDHPSIGITLGSMAVLYAEEGDTTKALAYQRRATALRIKLAEISIGREDSSKRQLRHGLSYFRFHVLLLNRVAGDASALLSESFKVTQWALQSEAGDAVAQMSARFAASSGELGETVRERQDLLAQRQAAEARLLVAIGDANASGTDNARKSIAALETRLGALDERLSRDFPEYVQLARPKPLTVDDVRAMLNDDEALIVFLDVRATGGKIPEEAFAWVVTKTDVRWVKLPVAPTQLATHVAALRCGLDQAAWDGEGGSRCASLINTAYQAADAAAGKPLPFDLARAHELYRALFGQIENLIKDKHLLIVPSGPLASLPFQVLVTANTAQATTPVETAYATAPWLVRRNAITVLPSVASLASLRKFAKASTATQPFIGFGNPLLQGPNGNDRTAWERQTCRGLSGPIQAASRSVHSTIGNFFRSGLANVEALRLQYPLPETADELCAVAASIGAGEGAVYLGEKSNEKTIKKLSANGTLAQVRIVHFATHGLLAGESEIIGATKAEPGLILTPPALATEENDGLLTASEIAQLKLDADWVVLSACNTAAGESDKPGTEALSGLARAFFYAGARALLVSHWAVDSEATVKLITQTFDELKTAPKIGRAEALRRSMLALIEKGNAYAHPANWAPFVVVGEGAL
jgi:CHAT domain-containing protein/tetratricopeptide (TPR) repeat protein